MVFLLSVVTGTPVAGLILVHPGIQFKPVESDAVFANPNLGDIWAYLGIESVPIHPEIPGRVLEPYNAGLQYQGSAGFRFLKRARLFRHVGLSLHSMALSERYLFGTVAVMMLGAVMLASGFVALLYVTAVRKEGIPVSVVSPWAQVIAGVVILIWPGLALWIVAVILGGGLILSGITGLTPLRDSEIVNPPVLRKIELWSSIVLGVLLIVLGGTGSAILLGVILGIALISTGLQRWRLAA